MRSGYKVTLSILTIMILVTLTIGTSYSYFSISDTQTNPNEVTTTCFDISFSEGSNSISLNADGSYAYPMSENTALSKLTPYKFTLTNNCASANATANTKYIITLNTLTNISSNLTPYIRYKINQSAPTSISNNSAMLTSSPYDLSTTIKNEQQIDTSYILASGELAPGASVTYDLYLWIDESATNDIMGYDFTGKVLIYNYL